MIINNLYNSNNDRRNINLTKKLIKPSNNFYTRKNYKSHIIRGAGQQGKKGKDKGSHSGSKGSKDGKDSKDHQKQSRFTVGKFNEIFEKKLEFPTIQYLYNVDSNLIKSIINTNNNGLDQKSIDYLKKKSDLGNHKLTINGNIDTIFEEYKVIAAVIMGPLIMGSNNKDSKILFLNIIDKFIKSKKNSEEYKEVVKKWDEFFSNPSSEKKKYKLNQDRNYKSMCNLAQLHYPNPENNSSITNKKLFIYLDSMTDREKNIEDFGLINGHDYLNIMFPESTEIIEKLYNYPDQDNIIFSELKKNLKGTANDVQHKYFLDNILKNQYYWYKIQEIIQSYYIKIKELSEKCEICVGDTVFSHVYQESGVIINKLDSHNDIVYEMVTLPYKFSNICILNKFISSYMNNIHSKNNYNLENELSENIKNMVEKEKNLIINLLTQDEDFKNNDTLIENIKKNYISKIHTVYRKDISLEVNLLNNNLEEKQIIYSNKDDCKKCFTVIDRVINIKQYIEKTSDISDNNSLLSIIIKYIKKSSEWKTHFNNDTMNHHWVAIETSNYLNKTNNKIIFISDKEKAINIILVSKNGQLRSPLLPLIGRGENRKELFITINNIKNILTRSKEIIGSNGSYLSRFTSLYFDNKNINISDSGKFNPFEIKFYDDFIFIDSVHNLFKQYEKTIVIFTNDKKKNDSSGKIFDVIQNEIFLPRFNKYLTEYYTEVEEINNNIKAYIHKNKNNNITININSNECKNILNSVNNISDKLNKKNNSNSVTDFIRLKLNNSMINDPRLNTISINCAYIKNIFEYDFGDNHYGCSNEMVLKDLKEYEYPKKESTSIPDDSIKNSPWAVDIFSDDSWKNLDNIMKKSSYGYYLGDNSDQNDELYNYVEPNKKEIVTDLCYLCNSETKIINSNLLTFEKLYVKVYENIKNIFELNEIIINRNYYSFKQPDKDDINNSQSIKFYYDNSNDYKYEQNLCYKLLNNIPEDDNNYNRFNHIFKNITQNTKEDDNFNYKLFYNIKLLKNCNDIKKIVVLNNLAIITNNKYLILDNDNIDPDHKENPYNSYKLKIYSNPQLNLSLIYNYQKINRIYSELFIDYLGFQDTGFSNNNHYEKKGFLDIIKNLYCNLYLSSQNHDPFYPEIIHTPFRRLEIYNSPQIKELFYSCLPKKFIDFYQICMMYKDEQLKQSATREKIFRSCEIISLIILLKNISIDNLFIQIHNITEFRQFINNQNHNQRDFDRVKTLVKNCIDNYFHKYQEIKQIGTYNQENNLLSDNCLLNYELYNYSLEYNPIISNNNDNADKLNFMQHWITGNRINSINNNNELTNMFEKKTLSLHYFLENYGPFSLRFNIYAAIQKINFAFKELFEFVMSNPSRLDRSDEMTNYIQIKLGKIPCKDINKKINFIKTIIFEKISEGWETQECVQVMCFNILLPYYNNIFIIIRKLIFGSEVTISNQSTNHVDIFKSPPASLHFFDMFDKLYEYFNHFEHYFINNIWKMRSPKYDDIVYAINTYTASLLIHFLLKNNTIPPDYSSDIRHVKTTSTNNQDNLETFFKSLYNILRDQIDSNLNEGLVNINKSYDLKLSKNKKIIFINKLKTFNKDISISSNYNFINKEIFTKFSQTIEIIKNYLYNENVVHENTMITTMTYNSLLSTIIEKKSLLNNININEICWYTNSIYNLEKNLTDKIKIDAQKLIFPYEDDFYKGNTDITYHLSEISSQLATYLWSFQNFNASHLKQDIKLTKNYENVVNYLKKYNQNKFINYLRYPIIDLEGEDKNNIFSFNNINTLPSLDKEGPLILSAGIRILKESLKEVYLNAGAENNTDYIINNNKLTFFNKLNEDIGNNLTVQDILSEDTRHIKSLIDILKDTSSSFVKLKPKVELSEIYLSKELIDLTINNKIPAEIYNFIIRIFDEKGRSENLTKNHFLAFQLLDKYILEYDNEKHLKQYKDKNDPILREAIADIITNNTEELKKLSEEKQLERINKLVITNLQNKYQEKQNEDNKRELAQYGYEEKGIELENINSEKPFGIVPIHINKLFTDNSECKQFLDLGDEFFIKIYTPDKSLYHAILKGYYQKKNLDTNKYNSLSRDYIKNLKDEKTLDKIVNRFKHKLSEIMNRRYYQLFINSTHSQLNTVEKYKKYLSLDINLNNSKGKGIDIPFISYILQVNIFVFSNINTENLLLPIKYFYFNASWENIFLLQSGSDHFELLGIFKNISLNNGNQLKNYYINSIDYSDGNISTIFDTIILDPDSSFYGKSSPLILKTVAKYIDQSPVEFPSTRVHFPSENDVLNIISIIKRNGDVSEIVIPDPDDKRYLLINCQVKYGLSLLNNDDIVIIKPGDKNIRRGKYMNEGSLKDKIINLSLANTLVIRINEDKIHFPIQYCWKKMDIDLIRRQDNITNTGYQDLIDKLQNDTIKGNNKTDEYNFLINHDFFLSQSLSEFSQRYGKEFTDHSCLLFQSWNFVISKYSKDLLKDINEGNYLTDSSDINSQNYTNLVIETFIKFRSNCNTLLDRNNSQVGLFLGLPNTYTKRNSSLVVNKKLDEVRIYKPTNLECNKSSFLANNYLESIFRIKNVKNNPWLNDNLCCCPNLLEDLYYTTDTDLTEIINQEKIIDPDNINILKRFIPDLNKLSSNERYRKSIRKVTKLIKINKSIILNNIDCDPIVVRIDLDQNGQVLRTKNAFSNYFNYKIIDPINLEVSVENISEQLSSTEINNLIIYFQGLNDYDEKQNSEIDTRINNIEKIPQTNKERLDELINYIYYEKDYFNNLLLNLSSNNTINNTEKLFILFPTDDKFQINYPDQGGFKLVNSVFDISLNDHNAIKLLRLAEEGYSNASVWKKWIQGLMENLTNFNYKLIDIFNKYDQNNYINYVAYFHDYWFQILQRYKLNETDYKWFYNFLEIIETQYEMDIEGENDIIINNDNIKIDNLSYIFDKDTRPHLSSFMGMLRDRETHYLLGYYLLVDRNSDKSYLLNYNITFINTDDKDKIHPDIYKLYLRYFKDDNDGINNAINLQKLINYIEEYQKHKNKPLTTPISSLIKFMNLYGNFDTLYNTISSTVQ